MSRASMMMMMMPMSVKSVAVLLLAMACCCVCEPQANADCGGPSSSCSSLCLCCLSKDVAMVVEKLKTLESRLEENQRVVGVLRGQPRVAFSAALRDSGGGNVGPFSVATPLKYKRVFSNTGSSYNPSTGVFTAQVKGMYFFRFSMFSNTIGHSNSIVSLMKNGERLTSVWDTTGADGHDMGSNAVVIAMEMGDNAYVELLANRMVFDEYMNYNTFSGFLLFPM
ncbi:complement C1q-like protein 2 [Engraulis encrasicolus]|uniref:complement C1q-like protein 2 n=1 Tax=Engraulis encrasicolus TaxID=184585 RepID=UPI002FCFDD85